MVTQAPNAVDVVEFQFKEHLRLNVFKNAKFDGPCNLVAVASHYGLIFVAGDTNELQVVQVKDIESFSKEVTEFKRRIVAVPSKIKHISVNCDSTKLAVVITKDNCPHVMFYDVSSFLKQNIQIVNHTRLSQNPACKILQIDWNPALPDAFTAVKGDGTLLIYEFKGAPIELPPEAGATCFCWSPKGKQLAVGSCDGRITQYKIDLKAVKVIEAPPGYASIISLCWVSSFQFFGVYNDQSGDQTCLICVDAPKAGPTVYTNYDDVCYSNGDVRPQQFYLMHQLHWNVLFVTSSNSMEIAVLGMNANGKWMQWNLNDNSRAALPLGAKHEDTLPIGCAFNVGTTRFKLGDDVKQAPALLVLSDHGSMCMFNAINGRVGALDICLPLKNVADRSGESQFIVQPLDMVPNRAGQVQATTITAAPPLSQSQQPAKPVAAAGPFGVSQSGLPSGYGTQIPQLPGLTINPVSVPAAPPAAVPASTSISAASPRGLFGSSGTVFKPAAAPGQAVTGQSGFLGQAAVAPAFPTSFGQKPFAPPVSNVAVVPAQQKPPVIATSAQAPPNAMPVTPPAAETPGKKALTPESQTDAAVAKLIQKLPVTDETEAIIAGLVRDECLTLEGELHDLLERGACVDGKLQIGTEAEMAEMARKEIEIEEFYNAIKENINTHDSEVYTLNQVLLQTCACCAEARSRYRTSKDPFTKVQLQSMPLDPASSHQRDEIARMMYYIDSQLVQANQCLDEQWDNFQDSLMKSNKLKLPTLESVYQSMVQHSKTLQKQKYLLKHIAARIQATNRASDRTLLNISVLEGVENLEAELEKLQIQQASVPQSYRRLIERQSKLNQSKVKMLRDVLCNKQVSRVCVSKPQLNNSTMQLTTLLAAPLSPIGKKPASLQSGGACDKLINSTPKPKTLVELKIPKMAVQTFTPTTQALGFGIGASRVSSPGSLSSGATSATNLFGATPTSTFNFDNAAATTVVSKLASAPSIFNSASVIPVPGTGNTSAVTGAGLPTSAGAKTTIATTTTTFNFSAKPTVSAAGIASGMRNLAGTTVSSAPASARSSGFMFAASTPVLSFGTSTPLTASPTTLAKTVEAKAAKPALLATPTTPPMTLPPMFGGIAAGGLATGGFLASALGKPSGSDAGVVDSSSFKSVVSASSSAPCIVSIAATNKGSAASVATIFSNASVASSTSTSAPSGFFTDATSTSSTIITSPKEKSGYTLGKSVAPNVTGVTAPTAIGGYALFGAASSGTASASAVVTNTVTTTAGGTPVRSLFGSVTTTTPAQGLFNQTETGGLFSSPVNTTTAAAAATPTFTAVTIAAAGATKSLQFGTSASTAPTATSPTSIFGAPASASVGTTTATTATSSASATGTVPALASAGLATGATTSATAFASPAPPITSIFASAATNAAAFGSTSAPTTVTTSTFGSTAPLFGPSSTTSVFGGSTASAFGVKPATPPVTSSTPAFGMSTIATSSPPLFGTRATTAAGVFGSSTSSTTAASAPAFGAPATTTAPVFGAAADAATPASVAASTFGIGSVFGGSAFGSASVASPFAASTTTSPFSASPFAATTTSTPFGATNSSSGFSSSGNLFAQPAKFATSGSIFGGGTASAATTTAASVFGSGTSVFGGAASTTPFGASSSFGALSNSPFAPSTTAQSSGAFGSPSTFGAAVEGKPAFGAAPSTGFTTPPTSVNSAFSGFGGLSVGGTAGSSFGQSPSTASPAANPFGAKAEQKSPFGSVTSNLFNTTVLTTTTQNIFGQAAASFGSGGFGSSTFGQPTAFGNTSFGSSPSASATGGAFSGGSQSVQQAGFGSPSFHKPAFGSAPVFGQQPAFGGNASFGAAPTFGGGATFGSAGKVFGGGAEATATPFGGTAAQSSTFGSLAQQNTVGFGNLAQQAATPAATLPFSGGSSFTNWRN